MRRLYELNQLNIWIWFGVSGRGVLRVSQSLLSEMRRFWPFLSFRDKRIQALTCDACHVFTLLDARYIFKRALLVVMCGGLCYSIKAHEPSRLLVWWESANKNLGRVLPLFWRTNT